jgi:hypothetical protein
MFQCDHKVFGGDYPSPNEVQAEAQCIQTMSRFQVGAATAGLRPLVAPAHPAPVPARSLRAVSRPRSGRPAPAVLREPEMDAEMFDTL